MLLLFGAKKKQTYIGRTPRFICSRCNNEVFRKIYKVSDWVSLYGMTVLPFSAEYYLVCPECGFKNEVSKEEAEILAQRFRVFKAKRKKELGQKALNSGK